MADYKIAFKLTINGNEGGYNPGIGEKETYMGIDRGANPKWFGWSVIDTIKKLNLKASTQTINLLLGANKSLQASILSFYQTNYWDVASLSKVNDQQIANNLFDCSVNQGDIVRFIFQKSCNVVLAKTTKPLLKVDGVIGNNSIQAINSLPTKDIYQEINNERLSSYKGDKQWEQWGKVWSKRLINYV